MKKSLFWICMPVLIGIGCRQEKLPVQESNEYIKSQISKMVPVTLTCDISYLPAQEIQVLKLLVKASQNIDQAFLIQVYENNPQLMTTLKESADERSKACFDLFRIMFGPWDRLNDNHPFVGILEKPAGANFYPTDMTKEEFDVWLKNHPEDKNTFESNFTMIRRMDNHLVSIPYSEFFKDQLQPMTRLLRQAAGLTSDQTLAKYLESRAEGLMTDDYYQSDMDWMDLTGDIEVVIGPYEVYEDELFGCKAAFESFICIVDQEESKKQKEIASYIADMEANLPVPQQYKNLDRGDSSPIKVVHLIYSAGDTKAGIQTIAFNLPNDERVREAKGSKKVMLKNVMKAKYDSIYVPIVDRALAPASLEKVSFDAYFYHILLHEVSHGLGPGSILVNGEKTTVNKSLKELYSVIEECKADVLGVFFVQYLIDTGVLSKPLETSLYASNVGGMFRSIRFGIDEAHGGGVIIQLNYFLDEGACTVDHEGRFLVNDAKMKTAVRDLAHDLLMIEAQGNYEAAKSFIEKYRIIRPEVQSALDRLTHIPVDIRPVYPIEKEI
jgi:hypothetical protein